MTIIPQITGKVYPDRTFTIGVAPRQKKRAADRKYDIDYQQQPEQNYYALEEWLTGKTNVLGKFCSISENPNATKEVIEIDENRQDAVEVLESLERHCSTDLSPYYNCDVDLDSPLLVKSLKSSRKPRNPYGTHGITTYGKRVVKNATLLLERRFGKNRLGFVTCSLPSLPSCEHRKINAVWSEITRRFYQKIKRQLEKVSQPFIYVGVTEIQEKRFKKYGVPCPHLHFVYVSREGAYKRYYLFICQIHRAWNEAIQEGLVFAGSTFRLDEVQSWGSVHASRVKKSAAAYLGKYISKGCGVLERMKEAGWTEFPKQWWTACKYAKKMFKDSIVRIHANICEQLFYDTEKLFEELVILYYQPIWIDVGGDSYRCGLVGTLSDKAYQDIIAMSRIAMNK